MNKVKVKSVSTTRGRTLLKLAERAAIRAARASIGDTKKPK